MVVEQPHGEASHGSVALEVALPESAAQEMLWLPVKCANAVMPVKGAGTMTSVISASAVYVGLVQEHIESENARLEREQQFWAKEIVVKIEYKYCPNLTIIDTPGGPWGSRAFLCRHAAGCLCVALSQVSTATGACCKISLLPAVVQHCTQP